MRGRSFWLSLGLLWGLSSAIPAFAQGCLDKALQDPRRVALVIGNSDYDESPLKNPRRDALAVAELFNCLGYHVTTESDLNAAQFPEVVRAFASGIEKGDWVAFYYSGHGVQAPDQQTRQDVNYFLPIDNAEIATLADLSKFAVHMNWVRATLFERQPSFGLFLIDACRDNPLAGLPSVKGSGTKGLARVVAFQEEITQFATQSGDVAEEGDPNGNSPYVVALLSELPVVGRSVQDSLAKVTGKVVELTRESRGEKFAQKPQVFPNLTDSPAFFPSNSAASSPIPIYVPPEETSGLKWVAGVVLLALALGLIWVVRLQLVGSVPAGASRGDAAKHNEPSGAGHAHQPRVQGREGGAPPRTLLVRDALTGKTHCRLHTGQRVVVGRQAEKPVDIRIDRKELSSIHAEFGCDAEGPYVRDLNSTNGVWLGKDRQIAPDIKHRVEVGASVFLADNRTVIRMDWG